MIFNRIHFGLYLILLSTLTLCPVGGFAQLIQTSDPIPSEAQIMIHLEQMLDTWEVETAMQKRGTERSPGIVPVPPINKDKLALQLRMVEGDMEFDPGPRVQSFIYRFVREKRKETEALLGLTHAYAPLIDHEIRERKLPHNLRYLPAALSAYNTLAISDHGNAGLWQLNFHTALRYGLNCGPNVDERRDPVLATSAALNYITDLFQQFKSWDKTLLAYTCGPANLNKAISRAPANASFEILYEFLPASGRDYWPAFVAINYLGQYYGLYQLQPLPIELPIRKETVKVEQELDFVAIAQVLNIPQNRLQALNPTYRGNAVCIDGEFGELCLPFEYANEFLAKERALYARASTENPPAASEPEVEGKRAPGTPAPVSKTPETPAPVKKTSTERAKPEPKPVAKPVIPANTVPLNYTIQPGDNLGRIAEKYGVRVSQLQAWNDISGTRINAGDQLVVHVPKGKANQFKGSGGQKTPTGATKTPSDNKSQTENAGNSSKASNSGNGNSGKTKSYTVKTGDTLWGISQQFEGVSAEDIMAANKINADIKPGQVLKIPVKQ